MDQINWKRVLLGGLAAGLVINISEGVLNAGFLQQDWADAMKALGKPTEFTGAQIAIFNVWGFLMGIAAVWLYAAIRPRYGSGPKTALRAALAVWFLGYLMASVGLVVQDIFPARLVGIGMVVGIVETVVGVQLGGWLYREEAEPAAKGAAARA